MGVGGGNAYTGKGGVTRKGNRAKAEKKGDRNSADRMVGRWEGNKEK